MKLARLITTLFFLQISLVVFSQSTTILAPSQEFISAYSKAIGVKLYPGAISYKQFYRPNKAVEGIGFISVDGFQLTILNEKYTSFENTENLSWYIGYGGHFNIWSEDHKKKLELINPSRNAGVAVGIDGILGLDYKIKGTPLNVSVDWQPSFNFVGDSYFENGWGGIGVRYTF
ncbi:MAG: hypothetical protein WCP61_04145 [Chitinophagia bacterium]|jgi:hypothetical protein